MLTSDINIKEIKANARGQLVGKYPPAVLSVLIPTVVELIVTSISDSSYTGSTSSYLLSIVISLIIDMLMGIFILGQAKFYLNLTRGKEPVTVSDIFYGFKNNMDKAIILQSVYALASLVSVLPAIFINLGFISLDVQTSRTVTALLLLFSLVLQFAVRAFFGLSFFVLSDNPDLSVGEIFERSLSLMENKKGKYILTCLSFVPLFVLGFFAFFIGVVWVSAYSQATLTNFYLKAIGEEPPKPSENLNTRL